VKGPVDLEALPIDTWMPSRALVAALRSMQILRLPPSSSFSASFFPMLHCVFLPSSDLFLDRARRTLFR
jgi:hypothetical protein